jgi:hypothetical protein
MRPEPIRRRLVPQLFVATADGGITQRRAAPSR